MHDVVRSLQPNKDFSEMILMPKTQENLYAPD